LEQRFSDEAKCRAYLFALRWPQGLPVRFAALAGGDPPRSVALQPLRAGDLGDGGDDFPRQQTALTIWLRAMWHVTSQKSGVSALGLQRVLGLGNYKTAWSLLHKLRRAMVRPGRDRLNGVVEVDEAYWEAKKAEFEAANR